MSDFSGGGDLGRLAALARPRVVSPLHPSFAPAVLADRAFRTRVAESGRGVPLRIALERGGGSISVYDTICFAEDSPEAALNLPYAERLVKFLLWQRGGWLIVVGGPASIAEHLRRVYAADGARAFDSDFMASVYEHPFTIESVSADAVPEARESTQPLGGHFAGCRIGFDLGASDRKVSAVVDGEAVYTEEVNWNPRDAADPEYHYAEINAALKAAAEHLPRVDAIGGSSAGIFIDNRPRVASLFRGVPRELFERRTTRLFVDLQREWAVPLVVVNDGEVTALAGAMMLNDGAVLGMALGSSEAGGYVTPTGEITTWLNELAFCPVDYDPAAPADEWSGDRGCGVQYFSQQAVFRLAPAAGIPVDESLGLADRLKSVQRLLEAEDERARQVWEAIGIYVGYGVAHYADFYDLRHVLVLGRVTSGQGGGIILAKAREVLEAEDPALAARLRSTYPTSRAAGSARRSRRRAFRR